MPLSEETVGGSLSSNCYSHGKGGTFAYAVIADGCKATSGDGEVSLKAAWDLGYTYEQANGGCGPEGEFTIILFPGTRQEWTSDNLYEQIQAAGRRLYP